MMGLRRLESGELGLLKSDCQILSFADDGNCLSRDFRKLQALATAGT